MEPKSIGRFLTFGLIFVIAMAFFWGSFEWQHRKTGEAKAEGDHSKTLDGEQSLWMKEEDLLRAVDLKKVGDQPVDGLENAADPKSSPTPLIADTNPDSSQTIKNAQVFCAKGMAENDFKAAVAQLEQGFNLEVSLENIHLRMLSGEERRVQRLQNENNTFEYKFFSLDREGLPIPLDVGPKDTSEEVYHQWLSVSEPLRKTQILQGENKNDLSSLRLEKENDTITQIEFSSPALAFACKKNQCQCRR